MDNKSGNLRYEKRKNWPTFSSLDEICSKNPQVLLQERYSLTF